MDGGRPVTDTYRGRVVVFGPLKGKERQVAPAFAEVLGARVIAVPGLDTDQFGTFTGGIPRLLNPPGAVRAKARLAIASSGLFALAGEASYGPLPGIGWPRHYESLLFLDDTRGLEIGESHRSLGIPGSHMRATSNTDIAEKLAPTGWPGQAVIVRPAALLTGQPAATAITKGITSFGRLTTAIALAAAASADGHALVEPDLRAHYNPSRQQVLIDLGVTLARRLAMACPARAGPGYGPTHTQTGLPCADCGVPSNQVSADVLSCATCPYPHSVPRPEANAKPVWGPNCTPCLFRTVLQRHEFGQHSPMQPHQTPNPMERKSAHD
ncbi:DUF6671 family protein [Cryobacterium sp. CAN_C3]|uniref:DUF6671 family protein n=1 Tax=unclassified Cryobacterium TaxID=2649013 RepID=UPI003FA3C5B8